MMLHVTLFRNQLLNIMLMSRYIIYKTLTHNSRYTWRLNCSTALFPTVPSTWTVHHLGSRLVTSTHPGRLQQNTEILRVWVSRQAAAKYWNIKSLRIIHKVLIRISHFLTVSIVNLITFWGGFGALRITVLQSIIQNMIIYFNIL